MSFVNKEVMIQDIKIPEDSDIKISVDKGEEAEGTTTEDEEGDDCAFPQLSNFLTD